MLEKHQLKKMETWLKSNARSLDLAKWDFLFNGGSKEKIVEELLKYQNTDGGFGNGLEADVIMPDSNAVTCGEAIFLSYKYELDCSAKWFTNFLDYLKNTLQDIPSFWEIVPKKIKEYPRAPWWDYNPSETFTPNPRAVIASAMIAHGNKTHKEIGTKVAQKCFDFLLSNEFCGDHECYNLIALIEKLQSIDSPLITDSIISSMKCRISANVCFEESKWSEYYPQPTQFADSPNSQWYDCVKDGIDMNLKYLLDNINNDGVWTPNFSWGVDSDISREVTKNWTGYITVDRARIFKNFNMIKV